jgi:hypothetical protein
VLIAGEHQSPLRGHSHLPREGGGYAGQGGSEPCTVDLGCGEEQVAVEYTTREWGGSQHAPPHSRQSFQQSAKN